MMALCEMEKWWQLKHKEADVDLFNNTHLNTPAISTTAGQIIKDALSSHSKL